MEGLVEEVREAAEEVLGKEFIVKSDGNANFQNFHLIAKDYYDEMTKSTNTINVALNENPTIMYRIENVEVEYSICDHISRSREGLGVKLNTLRCKVCSDRYCKICGVEECCQRHRPYVGRCPTSGKKVTIYGHPEREVYLRALYLRDVLGLNVEVRPFGAQD